MAQKFKKRKFIVTFIRSNFDFTKKLVAAGVDFWDLMLA